MKKAAPHEMASHKKSTLTISRSNKITHCWASSHWTHLKPQEREPWKEGGEDTQRPPEPWASVFSPQLSEFQLSPQSGGYRESLRHAPGPQRWEFHWGNKILRNQNTSDLLPVLLLTFGINFDKSFPLSFTISQLSRHSWFNLA